MDIQKIIADLFTSKKRGDAPSAMLSQVLTAAKDIGDDECHDDPTEAQSGGEGLIGRYGLNDWWLSTFTAEEREESRPGVLLWSPETTKTSSQKSAPDQGRPLVGLRIR